MATTRYTRRADERISWLRSIPFLALHLSPLAAIWLGARAIDVWVCLLLYAVRMFCITAGFHRYFSHRAYRMGRVMQFLMAFGGGTAGQKGALWWAAHHRAHHKHSDTEEDIHSPLKGFWWSQVGWILCERYDDTDYSSIKDLAKYPELRWLNRHYFVPPVLLGVAVWLVGGWSMLVTGFLLSTVLTYHCTFFINSLTHLFGRRRYATTDMSRNSFILALLTFGEGWHNNHHYYQSSANMGFFWWELDLSFYGLLALEKLGLVHDLRRPPLKVVQSHQIADGHEDLGMARHNQRPQAYKQPAAMG